MDLEDDLVAGPRGRGRPRGDEFTEEEDSDKVCCRLISDRLTSILVISNRSRFDSVSALQIIHQENEEELEEQRPAKRGRRHVQYDETGVTQDQEEMEAYMAQAGMTRHVRKTQLVAEDGSLYWRYVNGRDMCFLSNGILGQILIVDSDGLPATSRLVL